MDLTRRQLLRLALASMFVVTGCTGLRSRSDVDVYQAELRTLLDGLAGNLAEEIQLASIARRIEIRSRELIAEHEEFSESFDRLMGTREATEQQLVALLDGYHHRRQWLRDDLFALRDELHGAVPQAEWRTVNDVLNRTGRSVARSGFSGA